MRHKKLRSKLNRSASHRKATIVNIIRGLLEHDRIITTTKKAKVTSVHADKLITLAKKNNLTAIRRAERLLQDRKLIHKLFSEIGPRFESRQGGYTRVIKYKTRRGDGTEMAILELTEKSIMPDAVETAPKKVEKSQEPVVAETVVTPQESAEIVEDDASVEDDGATPTAEEKQSSDTDKK